MGVLREIHCKTCGNTWCERCFPEVSGYATVEYCERCGPWAYLERKKQENNLNIEIEDGRVKIKDKIFYYIGGDYFVLENSKAHALHKSGLDPSKISHGGPLYYEYIIEELNNLQTIKEILDENLKETFQKVLKRYLETKPHWSLGNEKEAQKVGLFDVIDLIKFAKQQK